MKDSPTKTVCLFNSNRQWGGGEKWHFEIARKLKQSNINVVVITNVDSKLFHECVKYGISAQSFYLTNFSIINPFKILSIGFFLFSNKVETVIFNLPIDLKVGGLAAKLFKIKKVMYRRGMPHKIKNNFLNNYLFKNVLTQIIANSETVKKSIEESFSDIDITEKITVIYNGINLQHIPPPKRNPLVLGNLARLVSQKGQIQLIHLMYDLVKIYPKIKLLIAGEGPLKQSLLDEIENLSLENSIELVGHQENVEEFFNKIDIFIFPSLFEGSSNALLEALYFQKPVLAFDIEANLEIINHTTNGFLVPLDQIQKMVPYIKEIIENESTYLKLQLEGLMTLQHKFEKDSNFLKLLQII